MSEKIAELRKYLAKENQPNWFKILALFRDWKADDERELALAYAETHLESWDDNLRALGDPEPSNPAWHLVRRLTSWQSKSQFSKRKRAQLKHLKELSVMDLQRLTPLSELTQLESLTIDLSNFSSLKGLETLTNLKSLRIGAGWEPYYLQYPEEDWSCIQEVTDITPLASLTALTYLRLTGFQNLTTYEPLASLTNLDGLSLEGCKVGSLAELHLPESITTLNLSHSSIESLEGIEKLPSLTMLILQECRSLDNIEALAKVKGLQSLDITGCRSLRSLNGIECVSHLKELSIRLLDSLQDISALAHFEELKHLDLGYARTLKNTTPLRTLEKLEFLDLGNCTSVTKNPKRKRMRNRDEVAKYLEKL